MKFLKASLKFILMAWWTFTVLLAGIRFSKVFPYESMMDFWIGSVTVIVAIGIFCLGIMIGRASSKEKKRKINVVPEVKVKE